MAHYLAALGYMEQRGRGWLIMRREMQAFNNTDPELAPPNASPAARPLAPAPTAPGLYALKRHCVPFYGADS